MVLLYNPEMFVTEIYRTVALFNLKERTLHSYPCVTKKKNKEKNHIGSQNSYVLTGYGPRRVVG